MGRWNIKVIRSGENKIEIYYMKDYVVGIKKVPTAYDITKLNQEEEKEEPVKEKEDRSEENRKVYLNTIRNNIVRLVESNSEKFKSFITLTYNKDVTEEENVKYLNILFTKIRYHYKGFTYLWVLERTKKGRIHIHMLTNLEYPQCNAKSNQKKSKAHKLAEQNFAKSWSYFGKELGFVDIRHIEQSECKKCSLYLASYINKGMFTTQVKKSSHLYGHSKKTLRKPVIELYEEMVDIEGLLKYYTDDFDVTYASSYDLRFRNEFISTINYFDLYKKGEGDNEGKNNRNT